MNGSRILLVAALVLAALAAGALFFYSGEAPTPSLEGTGLPQLSDPEDREPDAADAALQAGDGETTRTVVARDDAGPTDDPMSDPVWRAALGGFEGRVVDDAGEPFPDVRVRLYRFEFGDWMPDLSAVLENIDRNVEGIDAGIDAGEARTGADGRFRIDDVRPRGLYMLDLEQIGGTGSQAFHVVQRCPGPGETEDVGDLLLESCGVLTGLVVDAGGEPLEGALVRAADLPGSVLALVPVERIDPEAGLLVTEGPSTLIEFPAWVRRRIEELPIPRTTTDAAGRFRLTGVVPGSNLVAITAPGHLSLVQPSVAVEPGEEKELGRQRMREGEWAAGKVVDGEGRGIPGVEVRVAPRNPLAPVHFATQPVFSDAEGRFEVGGMPSGDVLAAARREPGGLWTISEPVGVLEELVIEFSTRGSVLVRVSDADGTPVEEPTFQVLVGGEEEGIAMAAFGVMVPVDLDDRVAWDDEAKAWRIRDLDEGEYTLLARAPGRATGTGRFEIPADGTVEIELAPQQRFAVRCIDSEGRPVRNAEVFGRAEPDSIGEVPFSCGRTDADGFLLVDGLRGDSAHMTARHPAYGLVHGTGPIPPAGSDRRPKDEPLMLRFAAPGAIEGTLSEGGGPPEPGKWMVAVNRSWVSEDFEQGARLPDMPQLVRPDADGRFRATGLRPGEYRLSAVATLDALRSPGKLLGFASQAWRMAEGGNESVQVQPGATTSGVTVQAGAEPVIDGPAVRVIGSVLIDGRPGTDVAVEAEKWGEQRFRKVVDVDAAGRFDLGLVPVSGGQLQLTLREVGSLFGAGDRLFQKSVELQEGRDEDVRIEISFASLEVTVLGPNGSPPTEDGFLWLSGNGIWRSEQFSSGRGVVSIDRIPTGEYELEVRSGSDRAASKVELTPAHTSVALRTSVRLTSTFEVTGRVRYAGKPLAGGYLSLTLADDPQIQAGCRIEDDGTFECSDLLRPGSYEVRVSGRFDDEWKQLHADPVVLQPGADLTLVARDERPEPPRTVPSGRVGR